MTALYLVPSPHEAAMQAVDDNLLYPVDGAQRGGWWIVGEAPHPETVIVCVDADPERLTALEMAFHRIQPGEVDALALARTLDAEELRRMIA